IGRRRRCRGRGRIVEHHQRLGRHGGVALHHLHIAGECRFLFLVAHLERGGFDLYRLVAILRKALHGIGHALHRALRAGVTGGDHRECKSGRPGAMRDPPGRGAARGKHHPENHFGLADLPETDRVLPGWTGSAGVAEALAGWSEAPGGDRLSRFITTLPSNLTTSPPPVILSLSAVSVPFSNLTSTCSSDVTVPLPMSTNAWVRRAS